MKDNIHSNETIEKIVKKIVHVAEPEKIILFESFAKGTAGENSDVDLLIVKSNVHTRYLAQNLYLQLLEFNIGIDLIIATPEMLLQYQNSETLVYHDALRDGILLYAA